ncbi:MAG: YggS family pyridoxal phosphate-dependent enzyme [Verrucomicrobiota bacterium]|nr:YggS family pyridoxal phosphate-dependent enzyme [Verrucomicrobiota bacterium]
MSIAENLSSIEARITEACRKSGRHRESVRLMAVSKGQPFSAITEAAALGLTLFGESKIQEAKLKISEAPARWHWHMIGHLQSNKCRDAVHFFRMIHSVDSLSLAKELQKCAEKSGKTVQILIEVNIAGESTKFGYKPAQLLTELKELNGLNRLELHGLMTIAPYTQDAEKVRPFFRQLKHLKAQCEQELGAPLPELSMGMSGDFEIAIEEGATIVRLGTSLFGARPPVRLRQGSGE